METKVLTVDPASAGTTAIQAALDVLDRGGLVAFPTETVYGLGARVDKPGAIRRLRDVKGRSGEKALTVHIGSREDASQFVPHLESLAQRLMRKGWPGPLTLVFTVEDPAQAPVMTRLNGSAASVMYYDGTIGLRCPDDPVALALLRQTPAPVVATSANVAGHAPPMMAAEVLKELDGQIDLLVDAGRTRYNRPSTIVRVRGRSFEVLREGVLDKRIIEHMATLRFLFVCSGNTCRSPMAAAFARKMLADRLGCEVKDLGRWGIVVESAGASAGFGPASPFAVEVMARRNIDLSSHAASPLRAEVLQQADYVFVMTEAHRDRVMEMAPSTADRVHTLLDRADIQDPMGGSVDDYEACAERIVSGLEFRLKEIVL